MEGVFCFTFFFLSFIGGWLWDCTECGLIPHEVSTAGLLQNDENCMNRRIFNEHRDKGIGKSLD
jgi:hypothetical protein